MTEREQLVAEHLRPGDVIMHKGKPYRLSLVRLDGERVEIEAAPFKHESSALVTQYPPDRVLSLACCDDIPRAAPLDTARQMARLLSVLALAAAPTIAHRPEPPLTCRQHVWRAADGLPCHMTVDQPLPIQKRWRA